MNQRPSIVIPALVGGVALGILSALPVINFVNCACCAWVIGGGILAVYLYLRDYPPSLPPLTYGDGAVIGLLTGVFGGLVETIVSLPLSYLGSQFSLGPDEMAELEKVLRDAEIPPEFQNMLIQFFEGGGFGAGMTILSLVLNLVVAVVFAMIGAIIGLALFQKRPAPSVPPMSEPGPPPAMS